ncbi:chorismate--pyruvate lyase family protein [Paracandidimonas soli]|uniref:Probable chorismate pyruvate-lyase n=1 Tax=Paracandidimonas soli TaxID=1917182 RepID=A0A4R3VD51_9BURK|nr:chorismate lyase [Paracandidimonas soli]TCV01584.1 chorismate lyase [Paracandidimonas soli]
MDAHKFLPTRWTAVPPASLPLPKRQWLLRPGALTNGLRQQGNMLLRVMGEWAWGLSAIEACMLQMPAGTPVWIREVLMSIDGVDSVYARSFTPLRASHGLWQGMRSLRSRPLADMLYHDPQISRSPFMVRKLDRRDPLFRSLCKAGLSDLDRPDRPWARCSIFRRSGQPLLVAECFLPEFWQLLER